MQKRNFLKSAFSAATLAIICLSQSAIALEVAPYFHGWSNGLTEAKRVAGLDSATLAFAVTNGTCAVNTDMLSNLADARNYVAAGGRLRLSFGGQNGVYAEIACKDDNQLFALIEKLMIDAGTRRLDFDVEGHQLLDVEGTNRRIRVLARLQAKYPDIYTSFTLPGWLRGVSAESMNLLRTTAAAGVRIDMVNVMAMSFGLENLRTMVVPSTVAQAVIMTMQASAIQVASIYPNKTQAQVHAMMGVTPMIGKNDDGSVFSLADAQTVTNYVKQNGIGLITYWSFQRDQAQATNGSTNLNSFSGVAQSNYQFFNIFKSAVGYVAPAPTQPPAQAPIPAPACGNSRWTQGTQYAVGSVVSYPDGKLYIAKVANPGYNPTISTYFWSQYVCSVAAVATPVPAVVSAPAPSACSKPAWIVGKQYAAGSVVSYSNGRLYIAKVANPGYNPTISTYFWSQYAC